jgi:hypothetical protein
MQTLFLYHNNPFTIHTLFKVSVVEVMKPFEKSSGPTTSASATAASPTKTSLAPDKSVTSMKLTKQTKKILIDSGNLRIKDIGVYK